ncbi:PilX N-terminal domain-containing pilus assembly protein [Rhodanobacter sp. A1T4]|uniref:pilus assembly PilX family protein n=1 Tax=Rhodanobacter sp. A1T4 TaxID=2723087 RepID=UPI0017C5A593|nr:PilX N-terminal domain-containing pilus assembly protein [Rhodanobacter sp. A1T4]MBB6245935.1 type IV pilus assembly protein PilX [Rhodanobacter sp. A1T4]
MSRFSVRGLPTRLPQRSRQRGVALVVALLLLFVITLVGLAAVSGTFMQQKMSANFYDRQIAFQATEAAMRQAALAIQASTTAAPAGYDDCSPTASTLINCQSNPFTDTGHSFSPTSVKGTTFTGTLQASAPQYIIQYMGNFQVPVPNVKQTSCPPGQYGCKTATQTADFYRITARSGDPTAISGRAYVLLQSMFRN